MTCLQMCNHNDLVRGSVELQQQLIASNGRKGLQGSMVLPFTDANLLGNCVHEHHPDCYSIHNPEIKDFEEAYDSITTLKSVKKKL